MFEKNLKYYRLKKNMTKRQLAEACHITPMAISNYESGNRTPDIDTINTLADALGIHVVDFLQSRNSNLVFQHREFRNNTSLTQSQQEYVRESVEEYFSRFFDAVEFMTNDPLPEPVKTGSLKLSGNYEADATTLRSKLDFPKYGPINNLVGALENKGFLIVMLDVDNNHFSGINGMVGKYPYIGVNKNMRTERIRTTIAHELAHIMFNWDKSLDEKSIEKNATAIAGAFLLPQIDLLREIGMKRTRVTRDLVFTCEEYGVSLYLLVKRAAQNNIMSASIEQDFYIKANKADYRNTEPNRVKNEEISDLFKQIVFRGINEEGISIQKGAELLKEPYSVVEKGYGFVEV